MTHPPSRFGAPLAAAGRAGVAAPLGLAPDDQLGGVARYPIRGGSTGLPFLYVPLRDRATVDRAALDPRALVAAVDAGVPKDVFVFTPEPATAEEAVRGIAGRAYSRMFAPLDGVPEDPATGSASGPLAAYLVAERLAPVPAAGTVHLLSEQGTAMGRQSFVHLRVEADGTEIRTIEVGGNAVPVVEGVLRC
jgi:trans-2,3-dihydro-3-hydroxyanthranilate isomerase